MTKPETAFDLFSRQYNCAQAILATYGPDFGLDFESCLKIASPFGGGIARMGETRGAVTGAIMVLGLRSGGDAGGNPQAKAELYKRAREFVRRFEACHGSTICRDLLGCDVGTPEGLKQAEGCELFETLCPRLVRAAAEILEEMAAASPVEHPR
jgi:C_GCAxxG_C_C family probable redox protein